jgi:hypothetical protein
MSIGLSCLFWGPSTVYGSEFHPWLVSVAALPSYDQPDKHAISLAAAFGLA